MHVSQISRQSRELTTSRTAAFLGGDFWGLRQHQFSWRALTNNPHDRNPGMAFLIERWAAAKRKFHSLGSVAIILANRWILKRAFALSVRASMRASIFSTTAGTTMAARVKSAWATRCATVIARRPFLCPRST